MRVLTTLDVAPSVQTPNATMRTYASPGHNGAPVAVWRTDMAPGSSGPSHSVDETQVLVVIGGEARVRLDGQEIELGIGDSIMLPAGQVRQVHALGQETLMTLSSSLPDAAATVGDGDPVALAWTR